MNSLLRMLVITTCFFAMPMVVHAAEGEGTEKTPQPAATPGGSDGGQNPGATLIRRFRVEDPAEPSHNGPGTVSVHHYVSIYKNADGKTQIIDEPPIYGSSTGGGNDGGNGGGSGRPVVGSQDGGSASGNGAGGNSGNGGSGNAGNGTGRTPRRRPIAGSPNGANGNGANGNGAGGNGANGNGTNGNGTNGNGANGNGANANGANGNGANGNGANGNGANGGAGTGSGRGAYIDENALRGQEQRLVGIRRELKGREAKINAQKRAASDEYFNLKEQLGPLNDSVKATYDEMAEVNEQWDTKNYRCTEGSTWDECIQHPDQKIKWLQDGRAAADAVKQGRTVLERKIKAIKRDMWQEKAKYDEAVKDLQDLQQDTNSYKDMVKKQNSGLWVAPGLGRQ
jgi:hypothetical protein